MHDTSLLPSPPDQLRPGVVVPGTVLSMGLIELNWALMLYWIVWKRIVLDSETVLRLKWTIRIEMSELLLNWVAWNMTVFDIGTV